MPSDTADVATRVELVAIAVERQRLGAFGGCPATGDRLEHLLCSAGAALLLVRYNDVNPRRGGKHSQRRL